MRPAEIEERRQEVIRRHGAWTSQNIDLGGGVFTAGSPVTGLAERRVERVLSLVRDAAPRPLAKLRVLDLACYEGAFGIALAQHGASVLGIDAREEHVARAAFAGEVLGLSGYEARLGDVRALSRAEHGEFDVVLCLGILYHLDAPDCFRLIELVAEVCRGLALFETQVALTANRRETHAGHEYHGRSYAENTEHAGAAKDNARSFWPTRASLLNMLSDSGFLSASEVLNPVIPGMAGLRDHITLMAWPGTQAAKERWPERLSLTAHPSQGLRHRVREKFTGRWGGVVQSKR